MMTSIVLPCLFHVIIFWEDIPAWQKALDNAVTDSHPDQELIKKIRAKLNQE